jgi:glycosyltransferase involved in cell wall biosynthesis
LDQPLVSILIPCYNAERYIGETLESVLSQTWKNIEIIIVNDGSKDNSIQEIERFRSPRIQLYHQSNQGQTAALNACLRYAKGEFIQYLDADDVISEKKIALQLAKLTTAPDCVATAEWGRFYITPQETKFKPEKVWQDLAPLDWLAISRQDGLGMMFPALWLIPKPIVDRIGAWREELTLNNDAEYFTRVLLAAQRVLFCEGARCYYRSGIPSSLSGRKSRAAWKSQFRVIELCEEHVLRREDSEHVRRGFALSWQHLAHAAYPYDQKLAEEALRRARGLHGVRIRPGGGMAFAVLSRVLGWRRARSLQVASGRP